MLILCGIELMMPLAPLSEEITATLLLVSQTVPQKKNISNKIWQMVKEKMEEVKNPS